MSNKNKPSPQNTGPVNVKMPPKPPSQHVTERSSIKKVEGLIRKKNQ